MAKFANPGDEMDLGEHGYAQEMIVQTLHRVTAEWLAERRMTHAHAKALLDSRAWHAFCTSSPDGSGVVHDIWMSAEDAQHFTVGETIVYHYKRDKIPSFGELAYIERGSPSPVPVP